MPLTTDDQQITNTGNIPPTNMLPQLQSQEAMLDEQIAIHTRIAQKQRELEVLLNSTTLYSQRDRTPSAMGLPQNRIAQASIIHQPTVRFEEVKTAITSFAGNDTYPVKLWVRDFECIMNAYDASSRNRCNLARQFFIGAAATFISTRAFIEWNDLRDAIIAEFEVRYRPSVIYQRLRDTHRSADMSVHQYILEMEKIAILGPTDPEELIQCIIAGLRDPLALTLFSHVQTVKEMKNLSSRFEELQAAEKQRKLIERERFNHIAKSRANYQDVRQSAPVFKQSDAPKPKPSMVPSTNKPGAPMIPRSQITCFNCSGKGHFSSDCPQPKRDNKYVCFNCQKPGHRINECPLNRTIAAATHVEEKEGSAASNPLDWVVDIEQEEAELNEMQQVRAIWPNKSDNHFTNSSVLVCLLDTGSPINLIRLSSIPKSHRPLCSPVLSTFKGLGMKRLPKFGTIEMTIAFAYQQKIISCLILPNE